MLGVYPLPLSMTLATHRLNLLHHPRTQLLNAHLHSSAPTIRTLLHRTLLAPQTLTVSTNDILLQSEFPGRAVVHVFQGHVERVHQVLGPSGSAMSVTSEASAAAAEEHVEEVHGGVEPASGASALLQALFAVGVVQTTFVGV